MVSIVVILDAELSCDVEAMSVLIQPCSGRSSSAMRPIMPSYTTLRSGLKGTYVDTIPRKNHLLVSTLSSNPLGQLLLLLPC